MPTDIVNLRLARKRKARTAKRDEADTNAARHGQPKAQRKLCAAREDLEARRLEGHRVTPERADGAPSPDVPGSPRDLDE